MRSPTTLFALAGALVGVLATLLVTHGGGDGRTAQAQAPQTAAIPVPVTTPATTPATRSAPPVVVAPGHIPPVVKPDPGHVGLLHVRPTEVSIPKIGISSSLVDLGLQADGTLQVPTDFSKAGWYSHGPYPGDAAGPPALIVGHIDDYKGPAVFFRLSQVHDGDRIYVKRADGSTATFVVYRTEHYLKASYPANSVYAPTPRSEIRLITCTGQFDSNARSYLSNFVAYAYLDAGSGK